ncbi:MAG: aspartyl-tRNA(Asn)/glutamyl-tRNA(Gln) amidotransferase subunit A [Hyphomicrobiaceae bacterium]|jgi:aspartyl-tRNA(Asn)/glutamyl-tRNA(Gln) amidotransferase subunit A
MELHKLAAVDLAAKIKSREISSVEATKAALVRLKAAHEKCNSVIAFEDDEAFTAAGAADKALEDGKASGPLHGVPLAHKDMFDRAGKIASWGGNIRATKPAEQDGTLIERFKTAGSHQIAALHLTEFAYGPIGHNYVLGHARNPWNTAHVSGGSSSGTAMSVATGAIACGMGSDTAGSLRLPASACGIMSLKPTWSRVSRAGAMPLASSLDAVGPIARDARDMAVMLKTMAGYDPRDAATSKRDVPDYPALLGRSIKGLKIGIDEQLIGEADASVQERLQQALSILIEAGAERVDIKIDNWGTLDHLAQLVQLSEAAAAHSPFLRNQSNKYGPQVQARVEYGHYVPAHDYLVAMRARGMMLQKMLDEVYTKCDVVMLPNFAGPIPTIDELDVGGGPQLMVALTKVMKFVRPLNYLQLPALTLPYPAVSDALPNGFQLMGRPFSEARLLSVASAYQERRPVDLAPLD